MKFITGMSVLLTVGLKCTLVASKDAHAELPTDGRQTVMLRVLLDAASVIIIVTINLV